MADIELRVVNESGELVTINLDGTADGKQVLRKEEIEALTEALINGKFGNWNFTGSTLSVNGRDFADNSISTLLRINHNRNFVSVQLQGEVIGFSDLTNTVIDSANATSAVTKAWTLAKFTTPDDVDGKFGFYTFDTDEMAISGDVVLSKNGTNLIIGGDAESITFLLSIASIDAASGISAVTKEWTLAKFFQQSQFINDFTGTSAQPILTDLNGKIASSLLPTQAAPQGNFTPTGGQEYPTLSGNVAGDYWIVNNVGAGYTFTGGDLLGETVYESAWMVLDINLNWILSNNYAGTVQAAWGSIIGTLTDQTDLNNALGLKADQIDLDTTNSNVSSNTVAIGNKAEQSALDTTNTNVATNETNIATNADDIDANTIAIGLRATQADLDTTNTNVSTNTTNISNNATAISGKLDDVTAGTNVTIDKTDPLNPVISASGGTGGDGNYITYSGSTSGTALANATALLNDLSTTDELFIPKGTYNIGTAVIPEGKTLRFESGAIFNATQGLTATHTKIKAGANQIFTLTSLVDGIWKVGDCYPEWFGAKGDGTGTTDAEAINKTLTVFSEPQIEVLPGGVNLGNSWITAISNRVKLTGTIYNIEQSIVVPYCGYLEMESFTILLSGDGFFDSMIISYYKPFVVKGGNVVIRTYDDQSAYQVSGKTEQDKIDNSYVQNPAVFINNRKITQRFQYQIDDYRLYSGMFDMNIRPTRILGDINNPFAVQQYLYTGMVLQPFNADVPYTEPLLAGNYYSIRTWTAGDDFSNLLDDYKTAPASGFFTSGRYYCIMDYQAGDDFTNVGASVNQTGEIFEATTTGTAANWTNGSGVSPTRFQCKWDGGSYEMTPNVWTENTFVQELGNDMYFNSFENIYIEQPNVGIELANDGYGTPNNSHHFHKCFIDKAVGVSIVITNAGNANRFTDCMIQCYPGADIQVVQIDGSLNVISGYFWDNIYEGAVVLGNGKWNQVELGKNDLAARQTVFGNPELWQNTSGFLTSHALVKNADDGIMNFLGKKLGIGYYDNFRDGEALTTDPRATLDVATKDTDDVNEPGAIIETYATSAFRDLATLYLRQSTEGGTQQGYGASVVFSQVRNQGTTPTPLTDFQTGRIQSTRRDISATYGDYDFDFLCRRANVLDLKFRMKSNKVMHIVPSTSQSAGEAGDFYIEPTGEMMLWNVAANDWLQVQLIPKP